ncbi:MAG: DUF6541 family protein [Pseudonocardiales bacterium]
MLQLLRGSGAVVLVGWLPGLMLLLALRPGAGWLRNVALAPVVSLGLLMTWALIVEAVGWSVRPATVLPVALGVPAAALGLSVWRDRQLWREPGRHRLAVDWPEGTLLAFAVLAPLGMWLRATRLAALVPANDDGTHHGLFAERVLRLGHLEPAHVAVGDVLSEHPSTTYYPLAMHLATAMASGASGVPVGTVLDVLVIGLAAVALPVGIFVINRRLFPSVPFAAPAAALLAVAFPAFPYFPAYWGGLTMIAAIALVPAVVDAMVGTAQDSGVLPGAALLGLAWAGLFTLHVTELLTVAVIAVPLALLPRWPARAWAHFTGTAVRWLIGALGAGAVVATQFGRFVRDAHQRRDVARLLPVDSRHAAHDVTTAFLGTASTARTVITVLFALGVLAALSRLWSTGWLLATMLFAGLAYLSAMRTGLGDALSAPWYGRWDRVVINLLFFVATFAGLGAAVLIRGATVLARRVPLPLTRRGVGLAGALPAVLVAVLALAPEYQASSRQVSYGFRSASLAGPDERAAYAWLAAHNRPGDRVLNDITDGSGWMYALDGVPPVFAMATHAYPPAAWGDRLYLRTNAGHLDTDLRARRAADAWHVRYAYVGPRLFPGRRPLIDVTALEGSRAWRKVYDHRGALIFERVGSPGSVSG